MAHHPSRRFVAAAILIFASACGDDDPLEGIAAECNPLGGAECVTPWPSSIYEVEDSSTATGVRLDFPEGALPTNEDDIALDPAPLNRRDGFSPAVQIFTAFPGGVDPQNLVGQHDIANSLTDASPTVLIDMSTGERVAHFAEIDANEQYDPDIQALYIRPAFRLKGATRYAVGIRSSLQSAQGGPLPVPPGFQAIRDGADTSHERLERIRPRYDEIFAAFEDAGIPTDDLVLAWDFTTSSDESLHRDMLAVRDAGLEQMGDDAANMGYTVDADDPSGDLARLIIGKFDSPYFLTGTHGRDGMEWGADGKPVSQGTESYDFVGLVPTCATSADPVPIVIFGHGFFGSTDEARGDHVRRVADELCVVVLATEWVGMRTDDVGAAAMALNNANKLPEFSDLIMQGILNFITLTQLAHGKLSTELLVDAEGPIVDPTKIYFYGISQGHILGNTFMAYDPIIQRAALHNGGGAWSLMFERSIHWGLYGTMVRGAYPGSLRMILMMGIMQMGLDYTDPINVAPGFFDDPIPGTPPKQLLTSMSLDDMAVPNLSSMLLERTIGLPVLEPAVMVPYGMTSEPGPLTNGFVIWDEDPEPKPHETNALNEQDNGTHGSVRQRNKYVEQLDIYLHTGEVVHTCGEGPCDCTTGACD